MCNRPHRKHKCHLICSHPNASELGGLGKVVGGQAAALRLSPGETITRGGDIRRSIFAFIYPNWGFRPSRVAVRQVTVPDLRLSLAQGAFPPLPLHRNRRLLGRGCSQINRRIINLVISRRAIALPTIHDPFRHAFYRPRKNLNQRRCTARGHFSRISTRCRQCRRSILRAVPMLHRFAADLRTTSWMRRHYAPEIQRLR